MKDTQQHYALIIRDYLINGVSIYNLARREKTTTHKISRIIEKEMRKPAFVAQLRLLRKQTENMPVMCPPILFGHKSEPYYPSKESSPPPAAGGLPSPGYIEWSNALLREDYPPVYQMAKRGDVKGLQRAGIDTNLIL